MINQNLDSFNKVFKRYKLDEPIPDWVQGEFLKSRDRILVNTLKSVGKYSVLTLLVYKLLFKAMNLGIKLSVIQAKIIVLTGMTLAIGSITTGGYITYKTYIHKKAHKQQVHDISTSTTVSGEDVSLSQIPDNKLNQIPAKHVLPIPRLNIPDKIGIQPLDLNKETDLVGSRVNGLLQNYLKQAAPDRVIYIPDDNTQKVSSLLVGSINKSNNSYTLILRVVKVETSEVLWGTSTTFTSENKEEACNDIIIQLVRHLNGK